MHESSFAPSKKNGIDKLTIDLARAKSLQEKCFSKIARFVRWQQKKPASGGAEQIRRDIRLCKLLTEYESQSEIVGMIDFMRDLKKRAPRKRFVKPESRVAENQRDGSSRSLEL